MCGIIGYIGSKKALPILINGIKNIEYRGYDSAGIAIIEPNLKIKAVKTVGKIANLEKEIKNKIFKGKVGIAHTRWATHGTVTKNNSHPHSDCWKNIWLAHNGIIENYKNLKEYLIKKGHKFKSQTDSEVLVHLIEEEINQHKENKITEEILISALKKVEGTYGLVVIDNRQPNKIIAIRHFSPLVLGITKHGYIVASDTTAIIKHTNKIIYLDEKEIAVLTPSQYKIINFKKEIITKPLQKINSDRKSSKKNGFPHFMLKEIFEQTESIKNSTRGRLIKKTGTAKLGGLEEIIEKLSHAKRILIVACGTAYLAGKIGKYLLEEHAGIITEIDLASEFYHRDTILKENDVLLAISQSGETADTLSAIHKAKKKGILTLGIVNTVESSVARETDAGIYQHIGPEISVASTKAFTSQLTILSLLTLFLGRQRKMSLSKGGKIIKEIKKMPLYINKILKQNNQIKKIVKKYSSYKNFFYLGRKYNFPVALEGALKLKEISYIHAEGYSSGEMKHGPIAMIDKTFPSIFIIPSDSVYQKNISSMQEIKARGGKIIAIATTGNKEIKKIANDVIYIPKTLEMLTPILSVIPLQLFAYHMAVLKKKNVDKPRNLAKSVTVE